MSILENFDPHQLLTIGALDDSISAFLAICDIAEVPPHFQRSSFLILGIAKVAIPALLLGTVLYKALIPENVYIKRDKLSIYDDREGKPCMFFRSYNASGMPAVDLNFSFYIRYAHFSRAGQYVIHNLPVSARQPTDTPPVMLPWVPHTVVIPLKDSDVEVKNGSKTLRSIQGIDFHPEKDNKGRHPGECYLLVVIRGRLPRLGSAFLEMESYRISGERPEYHFGPFEHIDVLPPEEKLEVHAGKPATWAGWKKFDQ